MGQLIKHTKSVEILAQLAKQIIDSCAGGRMFEPQTGPGEFATFVITSADNWTFNRRARTLLHLPCYTVKEPAHRFRGVVNWPCLTGALH